jgi:hypothetical protein
MQFRHLTRAQKLGFAIALGMLLVAGVTASVARTAQGVDAAREVTGVVLEFGASLDQVSLLAPSAEYERSLDIAYAPFLTPELLAVWKSDSSRAIGRETSSPWPDRIEVGTVSKNFDDTYTALGSVVEIASDSSNTPAAIYPVALTLIERDGEWLIQDMTKGSYTALPERRTIDGTYVCLPHKNTAGPQTMECAFGLRAEDGTHYALDLTILRESDAIPGLITEEPVRIEGTFVPVEHLRTGQWSRYHIQGIIRVTSLTEL